MLTMSQHDEQPEPAVKKPRLLLTPPKPRRFSKIPIFIVDYHNDVLNFIYRCFATRHLPLGGNILVHFDSHPDMVISHNLKPSTVFNKDQLLSELSIENWIMPTCYAGHFDKLIWTKNSWCDQIPVGNYDFHIGEYKNEMHVSLAVDYFISEGNYADDKVLENPKAVHLKVISTDQPYDLVMPEKSREPCNLVLDIDLDYFSCTNPFLDIYKKANVYKQLQAIFAYDDSGDPEKVAEIRREQLTQFETVFRHLEIYRSLDEFENTVIPSERFVLIVDLVHSIIDNYADGEIDWMLINDAGNTSDHNGLPHHISTAEELEIYYKNFEGFLRKLTTEPTVITMARSTEDNYCPQDQVDDIQSRVVQILGEVYGASVNLKPILGYKDEPWDVMKL